MQYDKTIWLSLGYNPWVAEALEGMELTVREVKEMTVTEILDKVFTWHGFIGFTVDILDAVDNVRFTRGFKHA